MTLLSVLDAYVATLSSVTEETRTRYRYHAREVVRDYGSNPRWNRVDYDKLAACVPIEHDSRRSVLNRTLVWMGV